MSESDVVTAPFTPEQVESLNGYQSSGVMHEFTCGVGGHSHGRLRATVDGWWCDFQGCDYTQDWAHAFMANGAWHEMQDRLREMGFKV